MCVHSDHHSLTRNKYDDFHVEEDRMNYDCTMLEFLQPLVNQECIIYAVKNDCLINNKKELLILVEKMPYKHIF